MANRIPLIVDVSDSNKIKEIPSGDNLQLSGNSIVGVVSITGSGTLTIENISANNITLGGTSLSDVATSGNYSDLTGAPTNISSFTNDSGYVTSGSNVSVFANDSGYLTTVAFADLTATPTTLAGYGITDAATSAQGALADSAVQPGSNVSTLNNDAGYITVAQVQSGDLTVDVNNSGDLIGSVFGQDSTVLVDGVLSGINLDGTVKGNIIPNVDGFYDLGSADNQFRNAYISDTLTLGEISIDVANSDINFSYGLNFMGTDLADQEIGNTVLIRAGKLTNATGTGGLIQIEGGQGWGGADGGSIRLTPGPGIGGGNPGLIYLGGSVEFIGSGHTVDFTGTDVTIPGYVKITDLKTALQDGAGDYAAFKAWVLANL